jgi:NAD(P) transhydrogenase subunit alpha
MEDEVVRGATVVKEGAITWPPPPPRLSAAPATPKPSETVKPAARHAAPAPANPAGRAAGLVVAVLALVAVGMYAPASFLTHLTVFVLACFVGYMVIWNVKPALHTPLMSVTNAISSIIIIGGLLQVSSTDPWIRGIATATVVLTSVNIAGGFAVTRRMLEMFRK